MASLDDHINKIKSATSELERTQVDDAILTTLDLIALVKLRLAEEGKRADGSSFSDYNPIYAGRREDKGLQVDRKDFNFTGRLYASIQPEVGVNAAGTVEVFIAPKGKDNEAKVAGQIKRDGNILQPSETEIREATAAHSQRRINRALGLLG